MDLDGVDNSAALQVLVTKMGFPALFRTCEFGRLDPYPLRTDGLSSCENSYQR